MNSASAFWEWFIDNNQKYQDLQNSDKERLMNEFLSKLQDFHPQLYFQIGIHKNDDFEVVITADGRVDNFEKVEDLVRNAPNIHNWKITAYKQPKGFNFATRYKGIIFNPDKLWFMPLENKDHPKNLGIRVGIKEFDKHRENDFYFGISILLETCLGEKSAALDIDYLDICKLPENPEETGWIELPQIQQYIEWKKRKKH
jgi:hypothetical protein